MLAAEFGYNRQYALEELSIADLNAHIRYRKQCPPVGMLVKAMFFNEEEDSEPISKAEFEKIKNKVQSNKEFKESSIEDMEAAMAQFGFGLRGST